jgi:N-succinyldiaminopimelate aminotransferase
MESRRIASFGTSVFAEFSRLAAQHQAVNLGQGFPDFDGPDEVKAAAVEAIQAGVNQYAISTGAVALRQAIAGHARRFYGQAVDPDSEVVVTSGATEAIFDAVMAFVNPGDEVVLFEPFYDSYLASVQLAGGVPRVVELRAPDAVHAGWWFDGAELERAFSPRTRLVLVNTPHNPTGKVFTADELAHVGALAQRSGAVLVSDEVYEHLVFAPARHVRPATLPGLAPHTLTISSGGKSFSFTGWKVGWAVGPAPLVRAVQKVHQWVTFATASPFQAAIARALALPDASFEVFTRDYRARRDRLAAALTAGGLEPLPCEGTYFLMARTDRHRRPAEDDVAFCRRLVSEHGLAAIPPSVFYSPEHAPSAHGLARFAFCKSDAVLDAAAARLAALPGTR